MSERTDNQSFLALLFAKKAMVLKIGAQGIDVSGAIKEVNRQIAQALAGDALTGQGVTKASEQ